MSEIVVEPTPIVGGYLIHRPRHHDDRGMLERLYELDSLAPVMAGRSVVQANRTFTRDVGTVRGMHCQLPPAAEAKIVTCTRGTVFDVMVDLRGASPTFGHWWGVELGASEATSLIIPPGCAHGLQTMTPDVDMFYLHTAAHAPESEKGLSPLDPDLGIAWPREISHMSERDSTESTSVEWFREVSW